MALQQFVGQAIGQPEAESFLREVLLACKELNDRIKNEAGRVENIADRAFGCEPQLNKPAEKEGSQPCGIVAEIRSIMDDVGQATGRLNYQITRISKI